MIDLVAYPNFREGLPVLELVQVTMERAPIATNVTSSFLVILTYPDYAFLLLSDFALC